MMSRVFGLKEYSDNVKNKIHSRKTIESLSCISQVKTNTLIRQQ